MGFSMSLSDESKAASAKGPHPHNLLTGMRGGGGVGGGREVQGIFWGLKFWPKGFFGSVEDARIFLGHEKNAWSFWSIVPFISSNQQ